MKIDVKLDEHGNPIMPEGWTFLTHGSSVDRWDPSSLGNDFIVKQRHPLCCVEKDDAKWDYSRGERNTAKAYGGKGQAFEIRVLFYKNPRMGSAKFLRDKLSPEQLKDVNKYYMFQDGRHPAVPPGTKLTFIQNGKFDEITNTNGNNILWYIPEDYLQPYLEDCEQMKGIETDETSIPEDAKNAPEKEKITNGDVEKELEEYYTDDVTIPQLNAYLNEKIAQVYGIDRLENAGIILDKFLDGQKLKIEYFNGPETYREIIAELDSMLEFAESMRENEGHEEVTESEIDGHEKQEEVEDQEVQMPKETNNDKQSEQVSFEGALSEAGFNSTAITGVKRTIADAPKRDSATFVSIDNTLAKTGERDQLRGGIEDGNDR